MWLDRLFRSVPPGAAPTDPAAAGEDDRTDAFDAEETTVVSSMHAPGDGLITSVPEDEPVATPPTGER